MIRLVSPAFTAPATSRPTVTKPHTVVVAEIDCWFERDANTAVHLRDNEADTTCVHCGNHAAIWYGIREKWEVHPARCSGV